MEERIPSYVRMVMSKLLEHGFEAHVVGGAVRDMLIQKSPEDWDIATNAKPDTVKQIFKNTVDTGLKHGTVSVVQDGEMVEVTTYRRESSYSDSRRPDSVEFVSSLQEDLARRDFTINAIAFSPAEGLIDYSQGTEDIKSGIIRCVGSSSERFREDALRMIRAVRFAVQLDFELDSDVIKAIQANAELINRIAVERIREEFNKILVAEKVEKGLRLLHLTGLLGEVLPEIEQSVDFSQNNPHHEFSLFEHTIKSVGNINPQLQLRLAMLFHDVGKIYTKTVDKNGVGHFYNHEIMSVKIADTIMKRMKYDNRTREKVIRLVRWHDYRIKPCEVSVRKAVYRIGKEDFEDYLLIRNADIRAQGSRYLDEKLEQQRMIEGIYRKVLNSGDPLSLKELVVNGNDLLNAGVREGQDIKAALNYLIKKVLEDPSLNQKHVLLGLVKKKNSL